MLPAPLELHTTWLLLARRKLFEWRREHPVKVPEQG